MTTHVETNSAALVFALAPTMTCEDAVKEIYTKTASSVHQYKMTMQAMVVIAMAWEGVSATGRVITAAAGAAYVPYTLLQYESMIDRAANLAQQGRFDRGLSAMMKDCNFILTNALCNSFNTASMTVYQHLTKSESQS